MVEHKILYLLIALVVLVYASIQVDINRKYSKMRPISQKELDFSQYINISLLLLSIGAVLLNGYHLFFQDKV